MVGTKKLRNSVPTMTLLGQAFCARREGLVTVAYPDGKWNAYGYGHNGPDVADDATITPEEALILLRSDLADVERRIDTKLTLTLKPHRFDALVDAGYNLGVSRIYPVLELVNQRKFKLAMDKLEEFNRVRVGNNLEVSEGLKRRRARERLMFETGEYGTVSPIPTWRGDPREVPMEWTPFPGLA